MKRYTHILLAHRISSVMSCLRCMTLIYGFGICLYYVWRGCSLPYFLHSLFEPSSSPGSWGAQQPQTPGPQPLCPWEAEHHYLQNLAPPNVLKARTIPMSLGRRIRQMPTFAPETPGTCGCPPSLAKADGGDHTPGSLPSPGTGIDIPVLLLLIDGNEKMLKVQPRPQTPGSKGLGARALGFRGGGSGGPVLQVG